MARARSHARSQDDRTKAGVPLTADRDKGEGEERAQEVDREVEVGALEVVDVDGDRDREVSPRSSSEEELEEISEDGLGDISEEEDEWDTHQDSSESDKSQTEHSGMENNDSDDPTKSDSQSLLPTNSLQDITPSPTPSEHHMQLPALSLTIGSDIDANDHIDSGDSEDKADETVVVCINGHQWVRGHIEFMVIWEDSDITWEPLSNVDECEAMTMYLESCRRTDPLSLPKRKCLIDTTLQVHIH
ncbi:unnamed protein product [Mycena citricolor]|uniref:Chromo domain-containing protein n=1 Tax=Mycena citricolor TaxID=2018698 RepID=A0AAD2HLA3_9AGAR|nr:unnamed protein product [Mycena citricolor]